MSQNDKFLSRLCKTCENIATTLDYDTALNNLVENAIQCLNAKASSIRLLDKTGSILEIAATHGLSERYLKKGPVEVDQSPIDQETLKGEPVQIKDVSKDHRFQYPEEAKEEGIRSVLCVPLRCHKRMLGVLRIYTYQEREFNQEEISFVSILATQSAVVIRNALRFRRMKSLNAIGRTITSQRNIQNILNMISKSATDHMAGKGASIFLVNKETDQLEITSAHGLSKAFIKKGPVKVDRSISDCLNGKNVIVEDVSTDKRIQYQEEAEKEGIRSIVCIPLRLKEEAIGTMRVYTAYGYSEDKEDLEYLQTLGDFGVVALENARLYDLIQKDYRDLIKDVWKWYDWGKREPKL